MTVRVNSIDTVKRRVELDMRIPENDLLTHLSVGQKLVGIVVSVTQHGAFVELEPGVDGLLHVSQMSSRQNVRPEEIVSVGDELTLKVIRVDSKERRIGLSLRELESEEREPSQRPRRRPGSYDEDDE